jgi:imidazolonepropionase-like amidohydrolase
MATVIRNVRMLVGEDLEVLEGYELWMENGKITSIQPESDEVGDKVVDGKRNYLIPGLIDLHVHMMWNGSINPVQMTESEGYEQMLIRAVANAKHYLDHGITTVRDIGSIDDISLHVAKAIRRELIEGPDVIACGKTLTMTGGHDPFWAKFVDGTDEALKGVREQIYKGATVIKVSATGGVYGRTEGEDVGNSELGLAELTIICEEAHKFGLKVASHAIGREGIRNSILAGVDTIEHGHYMDDELISLMEQHGVAWHPTLYVYRQVANQEGIPAYAKNKAINIVKIHDSAFKKYHQRDILIGAGSDAGSPGVSHHALQDELYAIDETVQNTKETLKTATVNAGRILDRKVGMLKEGYDADLVLLENNPLDELRYIEGVKSVFAKGKLIK